jgi:hypothetical protein
MKSDWIVPALVSAMAVGTVMFARMGSGAAGASAGTEQSSSDYKVLPAIKHGNLSVYPVVARTSHDTKQFITLDEGLNSGDVVVSEYGKLRTMIRRPAATPRSAYPSGGPQVNTLALVNNSKRPLILLAGEIVMGGNQDRVIARDRVVAPEGDPIDLSVFCVEPGRWIQEKVNFGAGGGMLAPAVRARAMNQKSQEQVWAEVRHSQTAMALATNPGAGDVAASTPGAAGGSAGGVVGWLERGGTVGAPPTSSYARVMQQPVVAQKVDSVAAPIEEGYRSLMSQLREQSAVGVVVAVNGQIVWADIFASTDLLQRYWPKLVRSYAAEAVVTNTKWSDAGEKSAQAFVDTLAGGHQAVESEPGLYRQTEVRGDGFRVFELTSLLPKTGFNLHIAKAVE